MGWCQSWLFFALPAGTAPAWRRSRAHPENLCWPSSNRVGVGQSWAAAPPSGVAVSLEGEALSLASRPRGVRGTPPAPLQTRTCASAGRPAEPVLQLGRGRGGRRGGARAPGFEWKGLDRRRQRRAGPETPTSPPLRAPCCWRGESGGRGVGPLNVAPWERRHR